jgi:hypothetical protein
MSYFDDQEDAKQGSLKDRGGVIGPYESDDDDDDYSSADDTGSDAADWPSDADHDAGDPNYDWDE